MSVEAAAPRLEVHGASKTFGGVTVLEKVNLSVGAGEIHGLVGQNGSGKSTLIKLLSGYHEPDPGASIRVDGRNLSIPVLPKELQDCGLAFVHQDLGLIDDFSVTENVRVGRFSAGRLSRYISWKHERGCASAALARLAGDEIDVRAKVSTLTHVQRATVAIARAIEAHPPGTGCVVFDESTTSLPRHVLAEFYEMVRELAKSGTAVIVVSHRLDEILNLCHRVTVLEDGKATLEGASTEKLTELDLTRIVLGSPPDEHGDTRVLKGESVGANGSGVDGVRLKGLRGPELAGVDIEIPAGEVLGVTGLPGSGFEQLPYAVSGALSGVTGVVQVAGEEYDLRNTDPRGAAQKGTVLIPSKRAHEGLALSLTALENLSLPRVREKGGSLRLSKEWQLSEFDEVVARFGLVPPEPSLPVSAFSGGNQQKLLIGKWLLSNPRFIALHEPTQAVDVGARTDILHALRVEANKGASVLLASIEADDLARVCDRVIVMDEGMVRYEFRREEVNADHLVETVYGT